ncbi:Heat-labile enterotoxin IIA, A chain, partial [Metarhizium majus ARSEF 297]
MKASTIYLALVGLSSAQLSIFDRAPPPKYKETSPAKQIADQVTKGMDSWFGGLKPIEGKGPIKHMPGSVPSYVSQSKYDINKDGGNLKGPIKKRPDPKCRKRGGACVQGTGTGSSKGAKATWTKFKSVRIPKSGGKAAAFSIVAPYAHAILDEIKGWDSFIGHAVNWFDNAMATLQEAIGGPQRQDVIGNNNKYAVVQSFKSLFASWETSYERDERLKKEALDREQERLAKQEEEEERVKVMEKVVKMCQDLLLERPEKPTWPESPEDDDLVTQIFKVGFQLDCERLLSELERMAEEEAAAEKKKADALKQEMAEAVKKSAEAKKRKEKEAAEARRKKYEAQFIHIGRCKASLHHVVNPGA